MAEAGGLRSGLSPWRLVSSRLACRFRRRKRGGLQSLLLSDPSTYFCLHDFSLLRREQQISIDSVLQILKIPIATYDAGRRVGLLVQQQVTHENSFFELRE